MRRFNPISTLRWLATGVLAVVIIGGILEGLVQTNVQRLAEQQKWDNVLVRWWPAMVSLAETWWFWLAVGVVGGVALSLWLMRLWPPGETVAWNDNARLTIIFDRELQTASASRQDGVMYYYWYHFPGVGVHWEKREITSEPGYVTIFLTFKNLTHTNYSRVRVIGGGILCEISGTHATGAVVRAMGDMRGRTFDVWFSKEPIPVD
jgi:hypothetical protein